MPVRSVDEKLLRRHQVLPIFQRGPRLFVAINRMLDALTHRGPNDRGIHVKGDMVLGHTRLSIVDVAYGHQPILSEDESSGLICNGEIYNFPELVFNFNDILLYLL